MKQKFFEERVDKGSIKVRKRLENGSTTTRERLDYGSTTTRKRTLFALITLLLMLSVGQMWGADYTIYEATATGTNCANVTKAGISVTFNSMKDAIKGSPITSVENTTYGIESGLKAPRWGGSGDGKNIAIVVAENYTATITAYVQVNTAKQTVTIKETSESGTEITTVSCSSTETVYQVQAAVHCRLSRTFSFSGMIMRSRQAPPVCNPGNQAGTGFLTSYPDCC